MSSRDLLRRCLAGERASPPPAVLHSWGDYKVEFAGFHWKFQYWQGGEELAGVEATFYNRFHPDWIHCGSGAGRWNWNRERRVEGNRAFVRSDDGRRWLEIQENYHVEPDPAVPAVPYTGPRLTLESKASVDEYFDADRPTTEAILESGTFDHMKRVADAFGDTVFIAINDGMNGLPWIAFEDMMIEAFDKPELVSYAIRRQCENFMPRVRAAKACGAHAYILSEGLGGSLGQLSPALEERVQVEGKRWLYAEIRKAGVLPIGYWLGDVRPHMNWLNSLDMAGLMIEEDKKGFTLDPLEIRRMLRPETCLFGNLDSTLLCRGTPEAIRAETRRQRRAAEAGAFVFANGSPLVVGTPPANIDAFLQEARAAGGAG
jgi:hypothetical protein